MSGVSKRSSGKKSRTRVLPLEGPLTSSAAPPETDASPAVHGDPLAGRQPTAERLRLQHAVMANMAEGVALISARSGQLVYTNRRYEAIFGYAAGEMVGLPVSVLNSPSMGDPVRVAQAIFGELERDGRWHGEVANRRKDGSEIHCRSTVSAFDHPVYGPVWIDVKSDITDAWLAQRARDEAHAELRRLSMRIQDLVEGERRELSREVHDQIGSALTAIRMKLEALARSDAAIGAGLRHELLSVAEMSQAAQISTRAICTRLRPPMLDDLGLIETCRWYVRDWAASTGISVRTHLQRWERENESALTTDLFRILQELLTNAARHSGASTVRVAFTLGRRQLRLSVVDDGRGFAPNAKTSGFGLAGVRERTSRHGGRLAIKSGDRGTQVVVSIPHGERP